MTDHQEKAPYVEFKSGIHLKRIELPDGYMIDGDALLKSNVLRFIKTQPASESAPNAFAGRITGRNRADIPSDAGVPPREQDAGYGEGWSVAAWPDEQRIDTIAANGPTGLHCPAAMCNDPEGRIAEDEALARAIGQPGARK